MVAARPVDGLDVLAWTNVGLHVAALALSAIGIRPGTPAVPVAERLAYLAGAPVGWLLGWGLWMVCAVALVAFLTAAAHRLGEGAALARLAVVVAVAGITFDLFCDSVYLVVFPRLAVAGPAQEALFLAVEKITNLASLVIANGAYSVSTLLLTLALRSRPGLVPFATGVGYAVFGFGMLLSAAGFTGVPWHVEGASAPTIGLYCVWAVLVARSLGSGRRS
jgi:hypothetical protein